LKPRWFKKQTYK